ncbi:hypothetical protein BO70DRAFT_354006 [Aspergillus heteromorphus CBS 117.55]|uniref:Uncharacterized protein n=1 Tax=Aspergillus heteromorphus CBS 117.55 TaxID=1448321 RepID=A0A317VVG6_9EURO|nr:uncharacterized protein BO70DRAFT_354006 [Aspergillus heteromorphus CBS 117.55]PWY76977.1 hypothetical protein BO70DRAFT_354006 [Aspergillus heteromorphus CBS 117.55]
MAGPKAAALLLLLSSLASASVPVARGEASSAVASSAASTATASCWHYFLTATLTEDDTEQNEDSTTTSTRRRRGHGQISHIDHLERRGHDVFSELGTCSLGTKIYKPPYPRSKTIQKIQESTSGWEFLGYFIPKLDECEAAATYTTIAQSADVPKATAAYWETVQANAKDTYLALGTQITTTNADQPHINIDHVYELQILDSFLTAMIEKYGFCDDFKTWFLTLDSSFTNKQGKHVSRLQRIYSYLPSITYPDVVAEDSRLNSYKAPMFASDSLSGLPTPSGSGDDLQSNALSIMNTMAVVVAMLRDSSIAELFKASNTRIYKAFLGIDNLQNTECNASPSPEGGWASAYSSWMEEFVKTQAAAVSSRISSVSAQVSSTEAAGVKNVYGKALDAFNAAYPTASWEWDSTQLLDWSGGDAVAFAKRGGSSVAACTPTASSSAAVSHSHSVTATHTGSTAVETSSRATHISATHSSKPPALTPTTHTSTLTQTEAKTHSSGSAEIKHSSSTKVVDTETAPATSTAVTKTTSSEVKKTTTTTTSAKDTPTTASAESTSTTAKETTTSTTAKETTSTTSSTSTSTTSTTTKESKTTTTEKETTTSEAKETDKTTTTKEETKTTKKSSTETEESSSCKKKKCKKGKCTCEA